MMTQCTVAYGWKVIIEKSDHFINFFATLTPMQSNKGKNKCFQQMWGMEGSRPNPTKGGGIRLKNSLLSFVDKLW